MPRPLSALAGASAAALAALAGCAPPALPPPAVQAPPPLSSPPPSAAAPAPSPPLVALARARTAAADRFLEPLEMQWKTGHLSLADYASALGVWFVAYRDSGITGPELVHAAEAHLRRTRALRELVEAQYRKGSAGNNDLEFASYRVAEAEFWLEEARERAAP